MSVKVYLHIHTKYSFDSFPEPKTIIKLASKRGLSAIAITDHDTIKGSLVAMQEASSVKDLVVVPGIEVKTNLGDIIGLYIQDEIKAKEFYRVIEEIKRQDGLVVLPHPYNGHGEMEELGSCVDVIEALNGRCSHTKNEKALKLADNLDKPAIACSDSHLSFEIGHVKTRFYSGPCSLEELRKLILNGKREFIGRESPFIVHGFSFVAEVAKRLANNIYRVKHCPRF